MNVLEGVDQQFKVNLYMANCAAALVIDPRKQDVSNIRVYSTGFASQFNINDSTYTFAATFAHRANRRAARCQQWHAVLLLGELPLARTLL